MTPALASEATMSMTPAGSSPADMAAFVKAETARWGEVIRTAGIKVEQVGQSTCETRRILAHARTT